MIKVSENKQGGFTLIEIILTLVIAAVVAAGLVQYFGTSLWQSSIPIERLRQALELQEVMENITADYRENYTSNLTGLQTNIGDNDYSPPSYTVVENETGFIVFDDDNVAVGTDTSTLLKVTIKNDSGILTTLFSSQ
jgi:prepilin-type N-terminal cleavage/methylation domain-containing protein